MGGVSGLLAWVVLFHWVEPGNMGIRLPGCAVSLQATILRQDALHGFNMQHAMLKRWVE